MAVVMAETALETQAVPPESSTGAFHLQAQNDSVAERYSFRFAGETTPDASYHQTLQLLTQLVRPRYTADSTGAPVPLRPAALDCALLFLESLYELAEPGLHGVLDQAFISVIYDGEIQLEWAMEGVYVEVEARADGRYRYFSRGPKGDRTLETKSASEAAGAVLAALLAR